MHWILSSDATALKENNANVLYLPFPLLNHLRWTASIHWDIGVCSSGQVFHYSAGWYHFTRQRMLSLLYFQHPAQCLAYYRHSINWINLMGDLRTALFVEYWIKKLYRINLKQLVIIEFIVFWFWEIVANLEH